MQFRVLGQLQVVGDGGADVELGSAKMRALLTLLLSEAGRVVPVDRLVDELWPQGPPATATGTLQTYVSGLRRLLEPDRDPRQPPALLLTRAPGYLIAADARTVDALRLPALVEDGGRLLAAGDAAGAEAVLQEATGMWRGRPLADLGDSAPVTAERARLEEFHLLACERLATAHTRLGRADTAVAQLEGLVAAHPLRERLRARLVEALYASGRQADALEACRASAAVLRDELGIDPGPELRALEQAVLRQDPSLVPVVAGPGSEPPAATPAPPPAESSSGAATRPEDRPLVGRRAERARLRAALAETTRGDGGVVVIEGEAGIGKTRLAEAVTTMARGQGWRVAWSRCADDAGAPALWPWTQLLASLGAGSLDVPADADPDRSRFSLFQDLRARLRSAAAQAPLLVVLDDVQAADDTSLQLLALLGRHLDAVRLLVLVTVRTVGEDLGAPVLECLAALSRESRTQRLRLRGLGEGDVQELVSSTLGEGGPHDGPHDLARELHARTDGNPFFVVELVHLLRSEHQLGDAGAALPPSVREVLDRRLRRLPEDTVALLRLAAVAGREADLALLETAGGMDAEEVITRLEPAVVSGVVTGDDVSWQWRFSHALVQETLLAGLSRIQAARLHAAVARALADQGAGRPADLERLAHHFFHAVPVCGPEPARRYATAAATAARERLAHAEAAVHTRRALSLLGGQGSAAERHDLLVALGDDLLRSGHLSQAQEVIGEALANARELGDPDRLAEAASVWGGVTLWNWRPYGYVDDDLVAVLEGLAARAGDDDPALRARLLGTLGVELAYSPRRDEGVAHATTAVELARTLGDPALVGRALNNYSLVAWGSADRVERRLAAADEALALAGRGLPARTEFFARLHRGPLLLHLGDVTGFVADLSAATRLGQGLTGPEVRPHLLYQETGLAMLRGEWQRAEELAGQAHALYRETSMWGATCCAALHQYTFRRREGRYADVLDVLVDAADLDVPLLQDLAVLAAAEAGDPEEARRLRRRWPVQRPQDWTTDALVAVRGWSALELDGDLDTAYAEALPFRGRQVVVGTATASWGSYDALLARLAAARGDTATAAGHAADAARAGLTVGSPWQVEEAGRLG